MTARSSRAARITRFSIAFVALLSAFIVTITASQGRLQFDWRAPSLLAQTEGDEGGYDLSNTISLNRVLLQLQENYVDAERFDPRLMLAAGLDAVQREVAQVVVRFDRPLRDHPGSLELQVGDARQTFTLGEVESLWEISLKIKEIFRFMQEHLPPDVDRHDVEYAAINGMLDTLDPHSVLLSPEQYSDMLEGNRGNFGGLGVIIRMVEGKLKVVNPMEGTPASRAGVLEGDHIVKIDDHATQNMEMSEAVTLLRGEPGTEVTLTIMREAAAWEAPQEFVLTRDTIKIPSVEHAALADDIGYIHLKGFQSNTHSDMMAALEALRAEMGQVRGLVLDLRDNPGGLLEQAIDISDTFVSQGTVVTTVGSGYDKPHLARESGTEPHYPIVVLINSGSASASEIVAGALKNHDRALILGDTSFGKGSVQVLYELQDGSALKLTIAQYLTPGNVSIQSVGIVPDIHLSPMSVDAERADLYGRSWVQREATLESHLDHATARSDQRPSVHFRYLSSDAPIAPPTSPDDDGAGAPEEEDVGEDAAADRGPRPPAEDPQVRLAQQLLVAAGETWQRPALLERLRAELDRLADVEDARLTERLTALGIDWSAGPQPPRPSLDATLALTSGAGPVKAGDTVTLEATVTNRSDGPLHRVFGLTRSSHRRFADEELIFGRVEPGESVTRTLDFKLEAAQGTRFDVINLDLYAGDVDPMSGDAGAAPLASVDLGVESQGNDEPSFALSYALVDQGPRSDGHVSPGERATVRLYVENRGEGTAAEPVAFLRNRNGALAELIEGRREGAALAPGEVAAYEFSFEARGLPGEQGALEFEAMVYDRVLGRSVSETLRLPTAPSPLPVTTHADARHRVAATATLRSAPTGEAPALAPVSEGATVALLATQGEHALISTARVQGWVPVAALGQAVDASAPLTDIALVHTGSPPRVSLRSQSLVTDQDRVLITGLATDDSGLRDFHAFVYSEKNHRFEARKVTYQRLEGARNELELEVPLDEGLNRIQVVTRDDDEMETSETLYVYRR